ncbi:hypothetical protein [Vibrio hippocampi]|uniref:Uncharacterized protein n=1 Tax=Vibrio hippocampi TaxID=654686 RepID=A0ABM8ZGY2_9VIBR|nr:hypothetical protein [Vibrio hippocampi]CAH0525772.1 hypothetical protein VHP8226_01303 [Vibrio hippocampi]
MKAKSEFAIRILSDNKKVMHGIFRFINGEKYFPPVEFINEFFEGGSDPCDQDCLMGEWEPFSLLEEEYQSVFNWWLRENPDAVIDYLNASDWSDWCVTLIEM